MNNCMVISNNTLNMEHHYQYKGGNDRANKIASIVMGSVHTPRRPRLHEISFEI